MLLSVERHQRYKLVPQRDFASIAMTFTRTAGLRDLPHACCLKNPDVGLESFNMVHRFWTRVELKSFQKSICPSLFFVNREPGVRHETMRSNLGVYEVLHHKLCSTHVKPVYKTIM
jgi:hypothetical protein